MRISVRYEKIQQKIINKLLDKYENSKTFLGTNQVNQAFEVKVIELFPKYSDDAEYDLFCEINDAIYDLEKEGLINVVCQRNNIIKSVLLNKDSLESCYDFIKREPKKEQNKWFMQVMKEYSNYSDILNKYFSVQKDKIDKNQKVEYYTGDKEEYIDVLKLVIELQNNNEEQFIRDFSIKLYNNSKRVEQIASKAQGLMYQYGDFQEKESVFEECGIVKTPTYVCMKGQGVIELGNQIIDLSKINGDIALSTESLKSLKRINIKVGRVITIENLTSFHDYNASKDFVIYLGGFHNKIKRRFLMFLYEQNTNKEYRHFGDIDAGGFYILEHLKEKTKIPFKSIYMDIAVLKKFRNNERKLTKNDVKRINDLIEKLNFLFEKGELQEDYRNVLNYMLEHNCKLEQESVVDLD